MKRIIIAKPNKNLKDLMIKDKMIDDTIKLVGAIMIKTDVEIAIVDSHFIRFIYDNTRIDATTKDFTELLIREL